MQYAHNIKISVFVKESESESAITAALKKLSGLPEKSFAATEKKERVGIGRTVAAGFNEESIIILELILTSQKHIKQFLNHLLSLLSPSDKELLRRQKTSRIDAALHFFIRLDKSHLLRDDVLLTGGGSCFHLTITLAAFPRKREAAERVADALFAS